MGKGTDASRIMLKIEAFPINYRGASQLLQTYESQERKVKRRYVAIPSNRVTPSNEDPPGYQERAKSVAIPSNRVTPSN